MSPVVLEDDVKGEEHAFQGCRSVSGIASYCGYPILRDIQKNFALHEGHVDVVRLEGISMLAPSVGRASPAVAAALLPAFSLRLPHKITAILASKFSLPASPTCSPPSTSTHS